MIVAVASGEIRKAISDAEPRFAHGWRHGRRTPCMDRRHGKPHRLRTRHPAGTLLRSIDVPAQPEAINVTPDGREIWVGSNQTGKVSVVDPASGT